MSQNFHSVCLGFIILSISELIPLETKCQTNCRVIEYNTEIKVSNGSLEEIQVLLIEVGNKESDWISNIKIPYYKGEKVDIIEASVLSSSGVKIRDLKEKEIVTRSFISSGSFYEDNFVKEFALKGNEYPYRIRYSYRKVSNKYVNISNWTPILYGSTYTEKASLILNIPKDFKVKIKSNGDFRTKTNTLNDRCIYSWEANALPPLKEELLMPPVKEIIPYVSIAPELFSYGISGSLKSWKSFGEWITLLNKDLTSLPSTEQAKVISIVLGMTDKKEIIQKLYHYMQDHTRYINVSIKIGGLKPYPASYVSDHKYGDCKALTIYMKALLEYVGIDSYYTLVNAGKDPEKINPEFVSQQFNHAILCVPLEKDTVWLENTANYLPYNYLGSFTQNRFGLLVNGENSTLVRIPAYKSDEILVSTKYNITLNSEGSGIGVMHKVLRGNEYDYYIGAKNVLTEAEQKELIEDEIIPDNSELISWKISQVNRDTPYLNMDLELSVSNQLREIGNSFVIRPYPLQIYDLESPEDRIYPVRIFSPEHHIDSIVYDLTSFSSNKIMLPKDFIFESRFGYFKSHYFEDGRKIGLTREYQIFDNEYPLSEYSEFYNFFEAIRKSQKESSIIINPL